MWLPQPIAVPGADVGKALQNQDEPLAQRLSQGCGSWAIFQMLATAAPASAIILRQGLCPTQQSWHRPLLKTKSVTGWLCNTFESTAAALVNSGLIAQQLQIAHHLWLGCSPPPARSLLLPELHRSH